MASVKDVAAYILRERGPMTTMKLQKLCYYSKAWHLVWEEEEMFPERFEAWANGPVAPELYRLHRGELSITDLPDGDPSVLTDGQKESIGLILDFYGKMAPYELSERTHREAPWKDAREGFLPGERANVEITNRAMYVYYNSLIASDA